MLIELYTQGKQYLCEILKTNRIVILYQAFNYNICLILTDGIINDMDATIDEIVRASDQPLSIIIVGVGEADFDQMEALDGDITPLFSNTLNKYRNRDIVQFVPFRDLKSDPVRLAKAVLAEVPK